MPKNTGEIVRTVVPGRPGARAPGLQQGDVIVKVNGQQVTPDQTVSYLIANSPVGSRIPLEIIRNGKHATVYVTLGERPTEEALNKIAGGDSDGSEGNDRHRRRHCAAARRSGFRSRRSLRSLRARPTCRPTARGVIITAVDPNSDAAEQGLQRGDLIMSVNNQPVTTPAQVIAAVDAARKAGRSSVLLLVKRGNCARRRSSASTSAANSPPLDRQPCS